MTTLFCIAPPPQPPRRSCADICARLQHDGCHVPGVYCALVGKAFFARGSLVSLFTVVISVCLKCIMKFEAVCSIVAEALSTSPSKAGREEEGFWLFIHLLEACELLYAHACSCYQYLFFEHGR